MTRDRAGDRAELEQAVRAELRRARRARETEPPPVGQAMRFVDAVDHWFVEAATKQGGR